MKLIQHRIVQKDGRFYPQSKFLFLPWSNYSEEVFSGLTCVMPLQDVSFKTYEEACDFLEETT